MRKAQAFKKVFMDVKRKAFVKDESMDDCAILMTPRDGYYVMTTKHPYYDFVHSSFSDKMIESSKMRSQMIDRYVPGRINEKVRDVYTLTHFKFTHSNALPRKKNVNITKSYRYRLHRISIYTLDRRNLKEKRRKKTNIQCRLHLRGVLCFREVDN